MFEKSSTDLEKENRMATATNAICKHPITSSILLVVATADGAGAPFGRMVGVMLDIYGYSTPTDTQILTRAFNQDNDHGLLNTLSKMKVVGHFSVTGTIGYDVSYIHESATPTGCKITFVVNRPIQFRDARFDMRSQAYNLVVGELNLNDSNKSESTGLLHPESKLVVNRQGQLEHNAAALPVKLRDVLDWRAMPAINQSLETASFAGKQNTIEEIDGGMSRPSRLLPGR